MIYLHSSDEVKHRFLFWKSLSSVSDFVMSELYSSSHDLAVLEFYSEDFYVIVKLRKL